jgi:hypothetical protein
MLHIQTAVVNNPTFIELQHETLKYFVKGDYTFTVFNDAKKFPDFSNFGDPSVHSQIRKTCERLNIRCLDIINDNHAYITCPAMRCADAMNVMLSLQCRQKEKYLCIDSDMFLIDQFDTDHYDMFDAAIVPQVRSNDSGKTVPHFWNGLYYFNMNTLQHTEIMNWRCNDVEGVWTDVGGGMYYFLKESREKATNKIFDIQHRWSGHWSFDDFPPHLDSRWLSFLMTDTRNVDGKFFSELYDGKFLHYRAGGNWEKRSPEEYRTSVENLKNTVYSVCRG